MAAAFCRGAAMAHVVSLGRAHDRSRCVRRVLSVPTHALRAPMFYICVVCAPPLLPVCARPAGVRGQPGLHGERDHHPAAVLALWHHPVCGHAHRPRVRAAPLLRCGRAPGTRLCRASAPLRACPRNAVVLSPLGCLLCAQLIPCAHVFFSEQAVQFAPSACLHGCPSNLQFAVVAPRCRNPWLPRFVCVCVGMGVWGGVYVCVLMSLFVCAQPGSVQGLLLHRLLRPRVCSGCPGQHEWVQSHGACHQGD